MQNLTFKEAIGLAKSVIHRFQKIEGKPWNAEGTLIELVKQVGELSKLVMVYEGYYYSDRGKENSQYESNKEKIGDELADILFAIIRLADFYDIDLEKAHIEARKKETLYLDNRGV
jgi:NTP pyrophosphatase (non-canonical NTP hydrolase)